MTDDPTATAMREHFAHCLQVLGGPAAASRRLDIDERALRRLAADAHAAEARIGALGPGAT